MTRSFGSGGLRLGRQEAGVGEQPAVQVGRHHERGVAHAGERADPLGDLHERHGVDEGVGPDPALHDHDASSAASPPRRNPTIQSVPDEAPTARTPRTAAREIAGLGVEERAGEAGHGLRQLAADGVRQPGEAQRRGAGAGARLDGRRHAPARGAVADERRGEERPGRGEPGQEVVARGREPRPETGQRRRRPSHGRGVPAGRRRAETPRRAGDAPRVRGLPQERQERRRRPLAESHGPGVAEPVRQRTRGQPADARSRLPDLGAGERLRGELDRVARAATLASGATSIATPLGDSGTAGGTTTSKSPESSRR